MGTHASAEMMGILGLQNHLWKQAHAWFDHWLQAVPNDIMDQPPVSCQFEKSRGFQMSLGTSAGSRKTLEDWPSKSVTNRTFYLGSARGSPATGILSGTVVKQQKSNTISSALGTSKSTAGLPFISSTKAAHLNMPLKLDIAKINRKRAVVYRSERFAQTALMLGTAKLHLQIETTRPQVQLIAYLYEANDEGRCRLITHGPVTRHSVKPNKSFNLDFELVTACHEIQEGHHLTLVIDTSDLQYKIPTKDDFDVTFHYDGNVAPTLDVPFV